MRVLPLLFFTTTLALAGCNGEQKAPPAPPPPEVIIGTPIRDKVVDYVDFTGRTEAIAWVEVRARATGYLEKIYFEDGAMVKEGDLLFEIDPRPYEADYKRTEAALAQNRATVKRLEADFTRAQGLLAQKAIAPQDFDKIAGDLAEARAGVDVAKANVALAKLKLGFTKVYAPISGKISLRQKDPGNLVKEDDTVLTNIVALDPMYVGFWIDERSALRLRRLLSAGKIKSIKDKEMTFLIGLADEDGYSHQGYISFVDNRIDAGTGTLRLRGVFQNPKHNFAPGMFVRIRLLLADPHYALLVPEKALGTDQGQKFLYVLNDQDEVKYRPVEVGALQHGMRVIDKGLQEGERFVLNGLQRVRPNTRVTPKLEKEQKK